MRYVLVADASRARLFRDRRHHHEYELVDSYEHPDSRARARDLMADANGRKPGGPPVGGHYGGRSVTLGIGRPGVAPDTEPKEVEAERFARELAMALESRLEGQDAKVVLVAPPHFLGLLKRTLSSSVARHVETTVDKDLTNLDLKAIHARVQDELLPKA